MDNKIIKITERTYIYNANPLIKMKKDYMKD